MHASKIGLADWGHAAYSSDTSPSALSRLLGVTAPTARRLSRVLARVGMSPGAARFAALARERPADTGEHTHDWTVPDLPFTISPSDNPIVGMSAGEKAVMNALRHRQFGATAQMVAILAGVGARHARRCLRALQGRGFAGCSDTRIAWGYGSRRVRLWSLTWRDECARALGYLPEHPVRAVDGADRVPPPYWHLFWSGTRASELTVSENGLLIAETLVGSTNPHARAWALSHLPTEVLRECRSLRGCDRGAAVSWLDFTIRERADA